MSGLFDNDEAYMQAVVKKRRKLVRNKSGQFCTEEYLTVEKTQRENTILKRNCEKYYHNWMAVADRAIRLERENYKLKEKIKEYEESNNHRNRRKRNERLLSGK